MKKIVDRAALDQASKEAKAVIDSSKCRILICAGTGCMAGGSGEIYERMCELAAANPDVEVHFGAEIAHKEGDIAVRKSGCHGFCEMGPLMRIEPHDVLYTKVKPEDCEEIFNRTVRNGELIPRLMFKQDGRDCPKQEDIGFYRKQTRNVLKNCGHIDAEHIQEYLAIGGYQALAKALFEMQPEQIIGQITESGLRGRGGAGYPTGKKWSQVAAQAEKKRYVVCNGDEGDPGAFMDRSIMEGDPHKMIEGMIHRGLCRFRRRRLYLCARGISAGNQPSEESHRTGGRVGASGRSYPGYRLLFPLAHQQRRRSLVCGEGSALTASIEGNRGMPRVKPPRTVEQGLFDKPTVLNNVETYANVPMIISNGADWFAGIGTAKSPGTKAFALTGSVKHTGLIEVPMGTTLREVIYDIGGGIKEDREFKAVQIGGPSGGCLTKEHLDMPLDFDSLKAIGAMIGSGGLVVMDDHTCMVKWPAFS